jgi:hypothetical protein
MTQPESELMPKPCSPIGSNLCSPIGSTRARFRRRAALIVLSIVTLTTASSCKKAPPAATPSPTPSPTAATKAIPAIRTSGSSFDPVAWEQRKALADKNVSVAAGKTFANVTFKPEVKVVEQSAFDSSLAGLSSDGHGAIFENASPEIRALKAGDIFLVKNAFAVKVLGVETDGDQTVLIVDPAKLSEVVQSGEINLEPSISFHGPSTAAVQPPAPPFHLSDLFETPVYAQNGTGTPASGSELTPSYNTPKPGITAKNHLYDFAKDALISGWTVEDWSVTPSDNSAVISAGLTKDTAGFLGAVTMNGTVSNFQFAQHLSFPPNGNQIAQGAHNLNGLMHFKWQIGKNTPGVYASEDKLKLPAGLTIPLAPFLSGLPLNLDISAAMIIHPGLTGGNEYSSGAFTIGFNGSGSQEGLTFKVDADQSISPIAPNVMVISFCVPRIELRFGLMRDRMTNKVLKLTEIAASIVINKVAKAVLSQAMYDALHDSPFGPVSLSNALASTADVYVQIIHTEGVTHASNITLAPCSKQQLRVTGQLGGEANLMGIKSAANTLDLFTKEFDRWDPGSDFCKSI